MSGSIERPVFLPSYARVGEGMFHPTARVHRSACIIGPVLLGEGVIVEEGAVVVGPASIGARSIIAANAIVSRSFIWDDCVIGAGSSVDSSLLADRSVVIAGDQLKNATVVDSSTSVEPPPADATLALKARIRPSGGTEARLSASSGAIGADARSSRITESFS